jgi:hypothetical protein
MGAAFDEIPERARAFAQAQRMFMVATAPRDGRVNVSPKGLDTLRLIDSRTVAYLDLTGSGNETAAHVRENGRITFLFMAFEGPPMILRFYGKARVINRADPEWEGLFSLFEPLSGARQIILATIDRVSTSCGFAVPLYEFKAERTRLLDWSDAVGPSALEAFRLEHNLLSIDGLETGYRR